MKRERGGTERGTERESESEKGGQREREREGDRETETDTERWISVSLFMAVSSKTKVEERGAPD